jgi:hypothetical protein
MKDPPHHTKDPLPQQQVEESVKKDPPHHTKDPAPSEKGTETIRKDPPHHTKFPPSGSGSKSGLMEITSYYILWDSYLPLEFNRETGWAHFLERVLEDQSDRTGAGA